MNTENRPITSVSPSYTLALWVLSVLFAGRIAGQALQWWMPQPFMPPFQAFQGSDLSYPILLTAQLVILAAMIWYSWRSNTLVPNRRTGLALLWGGGLYMAGSLVRLAIGLILPSAPSWFSAWISGAFHLVLAGYVLVLAALHLRRPQRRTNVIAHTILPYVWYPVLMAAAMASFGLMLSEGAPPIVAAYVPIIFVAIAIVLLELRFPERLDWRPRWSDVKADAAFMIIVQVALPRALTALAVLAIAEWMHASAPSDAWPHAWPLAAQIVAMVLIVDFIRYWLHRACHTFGPLWRLHEVHHSPDILYTLNVGRFHPLEKTLHFLCDSAPFLLLGVAPPVIAGYFLLYAVNGFFQHSNLHLRYGWLNYLVGSAETHRWHHARDPQVAACNFGNTTLIWDLLFGTWLLPKAAQTLDIGIMDRGYPKSFWSQMGSPFRSGGAAASGVGFRAWLANLLTSIHLRTVQWLAGMRTARMVRNPMRAQRKLLAHILATNRDTSFGRQHGFAHIENHAQYVRNVPVSDFEALRPFITAEIEHGDPALTREPPLQYMRTSGTTGQPKDIPLTGEHLRSLRRIHHTAVAFQYRVCPEGFAGGILALTSPAHEGMLANGKPFGSASGIVAGNTPAIVLEKFVVPAPVLTVADSRVKYLLILRLALARPDITYIGSANSTTLLTLIKLYREHHALLEGDLRNGTFFLSDRLDANVLAAIAPRLAPNPSRADRLVQLQAMGEPVRIADLWPAVRIVATWTCASAGITVDALRSELSPRTKILELGYLSSEFRGTITLGRRSGTGLPTLDTHFFEFVERNKWDRGEPEYLTLDAIRKGIDYYIIVTTPSGLYRYFINDLVRVQGYLHETPLLKFMQKGKGVTNITGEKLYESQVLSAVRSVTAAVGRTTRFVMMLADEEARNYRLYVEPDLGSGESAQWLAQSVDVELKALNVEYAAKRESDRLGPPVAAWLAAETGEAYKQFCVKQGQREGQFKSVAIAYRKTFPFDLEAHVERT
jgi:sterol desaturase/sphingolipid hydroxylase (fatty acid hydroxylase superfamily)